MTDGTPTKGAAAASTEGLSDGTTKFLLSMMKFVNGEIIIPFDAEAMAAEMGYKDANVVKQRWNQVKKKLLAAGGAAPSAGIKKRTPKKAISKKDKAVNSGVDDDDADMADTPTKTPSKKRGRKPKAQKAEEQDEAKIKKEDGSDGEVADEDAE